MKPRILVNVAFFALLGGVLAVWAATSLLHVDVIERPFPVTAEFASSPGLHADLQVTYLGVPVGRVESVQLRPGLVAVRLELDHDAKVPAEAGAQVLRKSAIGEPYIELTAPAAASAGTLRAGDTVPLARTRGTVDYQRLFDDLGATLKAVDPADAKIVVHELATGLNGHGDAIRDLIGDTHQLTATLAANAGVLDQLATELTELTGTVTDHRKQLVSSLHDIADVTSSVRDARQDLTTILRDGPGFTRRVEDLLQTARPGLDCLLDAGAAPGPSILNSRSAATLHHILTLLPTFQALLKDTAVVTPQATYLRSTALISIAGPKAAADYADPVPPPRPLPVPKCAVHPDDPAKKNGAARPDPVQKPAGPGGGPTPVKIHDTAAERESVSSRVLPMIPIGLAAAVLIAVALRSALSLRSGRRSRDH